MANLPNHQDIGLIHSPSITWLLFRSSAPRDRPGPTKLYGNLQIFRILQCDSSTRCNSFKVNLSKASNNTYSYVVILKFPTIFLFRSAPHSVAWFLIRRKCIFDFFFKRNFFDFHVLTCVSRVLCNILQMASSYTVGYMEVITPTQSSVP